MSFEAIENLNKIIQDKELEIIRLSKIIEEERAQSKLELQKKQFFYENLLSLIPGYIYWLDTNNVHQGCNDLYAQHAELFSRKEIIGKRDADLPWSDHAQEMTLTNQRVMDSGIPHMVEEYEVMATGTRIYNTTKLPIYNEIHKVVGLLGVSQDITEHKKTDAALRKANEQVLIYKASLEELMTNVRANLSIPLTGLIMIAKHMQSDTLENLPHAASAQMMYQSSQQLFNLLNAIFATADNKKFYENEVVEQIFDLQLCIQDLEHLLRPLFKVKKINFTTEIESGMPSHFIFDKIKLHSIILNLLISIIQNTDNHAISITIKLIATDRVYSQLLFNIKHYSHQPVDTISFEQLARNDANLNIAQKYISLLGGEIEKYDEELSSEYKFILSLKIDPV